MECVYFLVVYVWKWWDWWWVDLSTLINSNDEEKKRIKKGNVINCLCVMCWERFDGLLNNCWCDFMFVWLWTMQCYENGHLLIICVDISLHYSETWLWKCYVHWERMITYRGCTISRDVLRAAMDTIFWGTYRAPRWILYFEGRIARRDGYFYRGSCRAPRQMHGQICPPWVPDWETAGVYH